MNELSVFTPPVKRRRFAPDFKHRILAACKEPGASVARIAREHDLNANLVHKWIRQTKANSLPVTTPAFVALPVNSTQAPRPSLGGGVDECVRLEIPFRLQSIKVSWPVSQSDRCLALLRDLLQ
ncbi:MAG: transposase [Gammaproteobacteria bacterium]|nr:transposase [Pseudomonadales bacterium]MCP5346308.1 transposase [Pseudomonadales bacterium]MCP5347062.1 transposase [Pseudomonadales bacterium]MCP5347235.1 transposase [Pseudomonadales bacterium]MCP5347250.1 transposase [Pseudomonadales bacterium]